MRAHEKWIWLLAGMVSGAAGCWLAVSFPGGAGEHRRISFDFREGREYLVQRVVDGDTVVIEPGIYVRYAGINTPETHKVIEVQKPYGKEATEANRKMVEGRRVQLLFGERPLDGYGRLLAGVRVRDRESGRFVDVGEELARRGLARAFYKSDGPPNREAVSRAVEEAKEARRGIWSRGRDYKRTRSK